MAEQSINDFTKLIAKSAEASANSMKIWKGVLGNPVLNGLFTDRQPVLSVSKQIQNALKIASASGPFVNVNPFAELFKEGPARTIRSNFFFDDSFWRAVAGIKANQSGIFSSLIPKTFADGAFPHGYTISTQIQKAISASFPANYQDKFLGLQKNLQQLSEQITYKGITSQDTQVLESFEATTKQAVSITEEITKKEYATTGDLVRLENFIEINLKQFSEEIKTEINRQGKSPFALICLWVTILSILVTILSMIQTCNAQDNPVKASVSIEEIEKFKKTVQDQVIKTLEKTSVAAKVRIACNMRYKPILKSKGFFRLKVGGLVHIINKQGKWVYITAIDSADGLPVSGWMLKKYLDR